MWKILSSYIISSNSIEVMIVYFTLLSIELLFEEQSL